MWRLPKKDPERITIRHIAFVIGIWVFLLAVYAVADEDSPLRPYLASWNGAPELSDDELEELLEGALSVPPHHVEARVSACLVEISIFYSDRCTGARDQPLITAIKEWHILTDLQEVEAIEFREAPEDGEYNHIRLRWYDRLRAPIMRAHDIFEDHKKKENYSRSSPERGAEILEDATSLAFGYLDSQGFKSREFSRACSGDRVGKGVEKSYQRLAGKNASMKLAYESLKTRLRQCRSKDL